ncbi:MAG: iron-sulfur cluster assembly scaffold protein [Acidobacteriota bacterium]|nr:iron-sulfur cluster assembly scaffold protein [Acidobacteriota bacterium]
MNFYPEKVSERFHAPQNAGRTDDANAVGAGAAWVCGAVVRFFLRIDGQSKKILEAKFQTNGCGYAIAAADILAEKIVGSCLNEIHGAEANVWRAIIEAALDIFPAPRTHCLELALKSVQNAFADFRVRQIEEFAGEKSLICTCFGVSEETIEKLIERAAPKTVEEVSALCNAGSGCGSCRFLIQELLDVQERENF